MLRRAFLTRFPAATALFAALQATPAAAKPSPGPARLNAGIG